MPAATAVITGDPSAVASSARTLTSIADDVARHAARLRSLASSDSSWTGTAATHAHARAITLPPKLDKVTASYGAAGSALLRYASTLAETQDRSRAAVSALARADDDMRSAQAAQGSAAVADAQAAATAIAAGQPAPAPTAPRYQASIDEAAARRRRAIDANQQAHEEHDRTAAATAGALKEASHQGIPNKSWWQHVRHATAHWAVAQWHDALSHIASIGAKVSVIAGIAAVVLAAAGMLFPPLEAAAAAAEGIAAVSGVLSSVSAAADELTTSGERREGLVTLGLAALPRPVSKLFRRVPIGERTGVLGIRGLPRTVPLGMRDREEFRAFGLVLRKRLDKLGYPNAVIRMRGSSVTGVRYKDGNPFDYGAPKNPSDFDLAIAHPDLLDDASAVGATMYSATHTKADEKRVLRELGLLGVQKHMTDLARRPASFMIYKDEMAIIRRGLSLRFPQ